MDRTGKTKRKIVNFKESMLAELNQRSEESKTVKSANDYIRLSLELSYAVEDRIRGEKITENLTKPELNNLVISLLDDYLNEGSLNPEDKLKKIHLLSRTAKTGRL